MLFQSFLPPFFFLCKSAILEFLISSLYRWGSKVYMVKAVRVVCIQNGFSSR